MANLIYPQNEITQTFAQNGNKTILPETNAGTGRVSLNVGFPPETQKPLSQGGLAPNRQDFNGALNLIYQWTRLFQSGGSPRYTATLNYLPHCIVVHNNMLWWCLKANGPQSGNGVFAPGSNTAYWQLFIDQLVAQKGEPEKVLGGGFNRKLVITSDQNWRVPYTGTYKITCIGGGGAGGKGGSGHGGLGGANGDATIFGSFLTAMGGSGGGGGGNCSGGGGGGAGKVTFNYFQLHEQDLIPFSIGSGANITTGYTTSILGGYGSGPEAGGGGVGQNGGVGASGASNGSCDSYKTAGGAPGGAGALTMMGFGGGGGGGGGCDGSGVVGAGGPSGDNGSRGGDGLYGNAGDGGRGGNGAIIIEYYDESIG